MNDNCCRCCRIKIDLIITVPHVLVITPNNNFLFLLIIQYGRLNIESAIRKDSIVDYASESDEEVDHKDIVEEYPKKNGLVKKISQNGHIGNGNSVITKESLILVPDEPKAVSVSHPPKEQEEQHIIQYNNNEVILTT